MKDDTELCHRGRRISDHPRVVNPPVYRASTILYPDLDSFEGRTPVGFSYGRQGTPTTRALQESLTVLERGAGAVLAPSGLAAVSTAILACCSAGDHLLVSDSVYGPTRHLCEHTLGRLGIEAEFFDPKLGGGIASRLRPQTRLVFLESPGSLTFEVQDVPAIAAAAHAGGAWVAADNTWSGGYFCKVLELGADLSVQACTKYQSGHADVLLGAVICNQRSLPTVQRHARSMGNSVGADEAYLTLRGLRTMATRLERHQRSALCLAEWLRDQPEVLRIMYPALPTDPGHGIWQRDFSGSSGLFGLVLKDRGRTALAALLEGLELFGMGYSWGSFESLLIPTHPEKLRTAGGWQPGGLTLRMHVGLENPEDLIADLAAGLRRYRQAK